MNLKRLLFALLILVMSALHSRGADLYVATNSIPASPNDAWSKAFPDLQSALNVAASNDTIYVAGHTWVITNSLNWTGAASYVTIRGGYAAANDDVLPGPNNPATWPTRFVRVNPVYTNRILRMDSVTNGRLEGVTLTGGFISTGDGAGLWATNCRNFQLVSCTISNNLATNDAVGLNGGGIYLANNTMAIISNCLIRGNLVVGGRYVSMSGGGICVALGASADLVNCVITRNKAWNNSGSAGQTAQGGGLSSAGTLMARNCLIVCNEALHTSGVAANELGDGGSVMGGRAVFENCTVALNSGQGIYRAGAGTVAVTNTIVWGNGDDLNGTMILVRSDIEDGDGNGVNGVISQTPMFTYGYYLDPSSPCVNTGTNATWQTAGGYTTQADGTPDSGVADMGYHYSAGFDPTWQDLYVSPNGTNSNSGLSWGAAKRSIAAALSLARDGSRIHVASGFYTNGVETFPLVIQDLVNVQILGTNALNTILRPGANGPGIRANWAPGLQIEGLMITGSVSSASGGGLALTYCQNAEVRSCVVVSNTTGASAVGGGCYLAEDSTVIISNCLVKSNRTPGDYGSGGGIAVGRATTLLAIETAIVSNFAGSSHGNVFGGGLYNNGGWVTLRNCIVANNRLQYAGGNDPYEKGQGIYSFGTLLLDSCTVAGNNNKGIYWDSGTITITNSIVWNNGDDIAHAAVGLVGLFKTDIEDGDSNGVAGCISQDPVFADTTYYHLASKGGQYAGGYFFGGYWTNSQTTNSSLIDALDGAWSREPNPNGRRRNWEGYGNTPVASKTFIEEPGVFTSLTVHAYAITNVGTTYAEMSGEILQGGSAAKADFYFCWDTADQGSGATSSWKYVDYQGARSPWTLVYNMASNLVQGYPYAFRCFVTNAAGEADWSDVIKFGSADLPVVTNPGALYVWDRRAELRGTIVDPKGPAPTVWFNYWMNGGSVTSVVPMGTQSVAFSTFIVDLAPATVYLYSFLASNSAGQVWASTKSFTTLAGPMTWYVATNGAGTWATNWSTAFTTVQQALDVARSNDQVVLAGQRLGVNEPILWNSSASRITMRGGYAATNDADAPGLSDPRQWQTILVQTGTLYARGVMQMSGLTNCLLANVTLTGGNNDNHGGAISMNTSTGVVILSCVLTNNRVNNNSYGAGLYMAGTSYATISNSLIMANYAAGDNGCGGGIAVSAGCVLRLENSVIATNRATSWHSTVQGGGIYNAGTLLARNCLMYGNWVIYGGGNPSYESGDGIYSSGSMSLENCTIAYNRIEGVERGGGTLAATNCIIWGHTNDIVGAVRLAYSDLSDGSSNGVNNCISLNPLFEGPATNNFRLGKGSPCKNRGLTVPSWMIGAVDLNGNPRVLGSIVDMGAYEAPPVNGGSAFTLY